MLFNLSVVHHVRVFFIYKNWIKMFCKICMHHMIQHMQKTRSTGYSIEQIKMKFVEMFFIFCGLNEASWWEMECYTSPSFSNIIRILYTQHKTFICVEISYFHLSKKIFFVSFDWVVIYLIGILHCLHYPVRYYIPEG